MSQTLKQTLDYALNVSNQDIMDLGFPIPEEVYGTSTRIMQEYFFNADNFLGNIDEDELPEYLWDNILSHLFDGIDFEHIKSFGGEGKRADYYTIYKFTKKSTGEVEYVKFDGWYASYQGATYSNYFFVKPSERLVTFYD